MEDFPQTLCLYVHFGAVSLIHSAPERNAATFRKVLAPFSVSHVIAIDSCSLLSRSFSLFFSLFLDFIAISDCVFNNKNRYVLGHTGYQIIITILVISTLNANLSVATRVYDVEGGAIFSKNSTFVFFDGAAWTPRLRSPSPIMAPAAIQITKTLADPSSETQGQLVGTTGFSWANVYNKSGRAPGHLLLPNEFQKRLKAGLLIFSGQSAKRNSRRLSCLLTRGCFPHRTPL